MVNRIIKLSKVNFVFLFELENRILNFVLNNFSVHNISQTRKCFRSPTKKVLFSFRDMCACVFLLLLLLFDMVNLMRMVVWLLCT